MAIYQFKLSKYNYHLLKKSLVSSEVYLHIMGLIESSPTSQFYCKLEEKAPNNCVYLTEYNQMEAYTICHIFSCDKFESDYSYQSITLEQFELLGTFLKEIDFIQNPLLSPLQCVRTPLQSFQITARLRSYLIFLQLQLIVFLYMPVHHNEI